MNIIDQVYVVLIYVWSGLDKMVVGAVLTSMIVAILRMKKAGKFSWAEALLCGVFCGIALMGLSFLGSLTGIAVPAALSASAAPVIAGAIGWYGTEKTVRYVENKIGGSNDSNQS